MSFHKKIVVIGASGIGRSHSIVHLIDKGKPGVVIADINDDHKYFHKQERINNPLNFHIVRFHKKFRLPRKKKKAFKKWLQRPGAIHPFTQQVYNTYLSIGIKHHKKL